MQLTLGEERSWVYLLLLSPGTQCYALSSLSYDQRRADKLALGPSCEGPSTAPGRGRWDLPSHRARAEFWLQKTATRGAWLQAMLGVVYLSWV